MDPAWITALVALAVAVGTLLTWGVRIVWKLTSKVVRFLDDYNGQPEHDGIPGRPGVMARLSKLESMVGEVVEETRPNGGDSMRDVLHRTSSDVLHLRKDMARLKTQVDALETKKEDP